jgi:hypothetical protein
MPRWPAPINLATNAFLNHFGFCDYPRSENESAALLKYNTWEQGKKGFNK